MAELHTIKDERTIYCRIAMKANGGEWNPVTGSWMFRTASEHANALCELYRATRLSVAMREALLSMIVDGTGALAWGFDPAERPLAIDTLDRNDAAKLLAAGSAARRVLGVHPLDELDNPADEAATFDASEFEVRARRSQRRRRDVA
jgi:hypothetical protein